MLYHAIVEYVEFNCTTIHLPSVHVCLSIIDKMVANKMTILLEEVYYMPILTAHHDPLCVFVCVMHVLLMFQPMSSYNFLP